MPCHDEQELEGLLRGELSSAQEERVRSHLDGCRECAERLSDLAGNLRMLDSLQSVLGKPDGAVGDDPHLPETIDEYEVVREIGRGGMGIVYEAQQQHPQRAVAVKVLYGTASADRYRVKLFRREAQALARLRHPGIAAIHAAGQTADGQHYIVMELAPGVPLNDYVAAHELTKGQRLELMGQVCDAINYAHQRGVIHLDIKPANILVDPQGNAKILDFGLARIVDPDATMTTSVTDVGKLQGTLPYMSPEQLRGDPASVDLRSDVYSLGVILYELLTGQLPYEIDRSLRHGAFSYAHEEPPKKPSSVNRTLRGDLETIMLKALEVEPARRYQSALAFAEDLERYTTGQPILARPSSGMYHFRKLVTRHKAPFAAAAVFMLMLMGFAVWMSALYGRAQRAEGLAQQRLQEADQTRADLQDVADFQADMLGSVDAQQLGHNTLVDLRSRFEKALEIAELAPSEAQAVLASFDERLAVVNRADVGRDLLHKNILEPASQAISERFVTQPLLEARLRTTVGDVYQGLGDYERAEPHLVAARDINVRHLGREDLQTLRLTHALGALYRELGRYDDGEPLLAEGLEAARRVLGKEHPDTLRFTHSLARLYRDRVRYDEAEALFVEALNAQRRVLGDEAEDTARSIGDLATMYLDQARYAEAELLYTEGLETSRRVRGEEHRITLEQLNGLAVLHHAEGSYDESEKLRLKGIEIQSRVSGADHPKTLLSMRDLADLRLAQRRNDEAESLMREVLEGLRTALGEDHPETLCCMRKLGDIVRVAERYDEAEVLYLAALKGARRAIGNGHPETIQAIGSLAATYARMKRYDEAELLYREAIRNCREARGNRHPDLVVLLHNFAFMYAVQRRRELAEPLAAEATAISRSVMSDRVWFKGLYPDLHGRILWGLERYEEAEAAMLEARRHFMATLGPTHYLTTRNARELAEVYTAWGKPEKAAEFRALMSPTENPQSERATEQASDASREESKD